MNIIKMTLDMIGDDEELICGTIYAHSSEAKKNGVEAETKQQLQEYMNTVSSPRIRDACQKVIKDLSYVV